MEMNKAYVVYADYNGEVTSEVFGAYASIERARAGLKSAVKDFYNNFVVENLEEGEEKDFNQFWEDGICEDGNEFIDETYTYGVISRFFVVEVPFDGKTII